MLLGFAWGVLANPLLKHDDLKCERCGEDGICKEGVTSTEVTCPNNEKTCLLGMVKVDGKFVEMKNCFPAPVEVVGCVKIIEEAEGEQMVVTSRWFASYAVRTGFDSLYQLPPAHDIPQRY